MKNRISCTITQDPLIATTETLTRDIHVSQFGNHSWFRLSGGYRERIAVIIANLSF